MADSSLVLTGPAPANKAITVLTDIDAWAGAKVPVVARYLGRGGKADVPPLTVGEARDVHAVGRAILPIYNDSPLNQGHVCASAQEFHDLGVADAEALIAQAGGIGVPAGTYVAADVEYGAHFGEAADGANWWLGFAKTIRASHLAGAGIVYLAAGDGAAIAALEAALRTGDPDVARLLLWLADWNGKPCIAANVPPITLPELPPEVASRVIGQQFCAGAYGGVCDLTTLDIDRLLAAGPGGFWLPPTPAVVPPSIPAPQPRKALTTVPVRVDKAQDKAYVTVALSGPREHGVATEFIFDTGAFEILLDLDTAQALGLPSLRSLTLGGVTGSAPGYTSAVDFTLGQLSEAGADCAVMAGAPLLFGFRWFVERGYALELDPKAATLTVYAPAQ